MMTTNFKITSLSIFLLLALLLVLGVLILILLFQLLLQSRRNTGLKELLSDTGDDIADAVGSRIDDIQDDLERRLSHDSAENRQNRMELSDMIRKAQEGQTQALERFSDRQQRVLSEQTERLQSALSDAVKDLQETSRKKLSDIQTDINQKLDSSLNERLDASFKTVSEQLNHLYQSLGELGKLEGGVLSLNRTLSNVKTRGIFGEAQLENILADVLAPSLYERNVVTKKSGGANRDAVEFAVRIPDRETNGSFLYLPVDSKFPASIYDRIREASEAADPDALCKATKELEQFIRTEARSIQDKYVDPPNTTDFAILFLPTESLYAEVLRIPGLSEECQRKYHIVISGPASFAALLNSLNIGFRYLAVNRDSQNILRLLSAIKSQYGVLSELINKADSRIDLAKKATSDLQRRAELINRRLSDVEALEPAEARILLGLGKEED